MTLVAATLDPANKGSNMTLSGGSLTATITSGSGVARSTRAIAATVYFEVATSGSYSGTPRVGLSQSGANLSNNLGTDYYGIGTTAAATSTSTARLSRPSRRGQPGRISASPSTRCIKRFGSG